MVQSQVSLLFLNMPCQYPVLETKGQVLLKSRSRKVVKFLFFKFVELRKELGQKGHFQCMNT